MGQTALKNQREFDLEDRLIDFAVMIIHLAESLPKTKTGSHIAGQIIRCATSPASNYGEAQAAESRKDFIHKMKISLKELRETKVWLKMILKANMTKSSEKIDQLIDESNQLISILIFVASVKTAKQNSS